MKLLSNFAPLFWLLPTGTAAAMGANDAELILFGANWCAPCRAELSELGALAAAMDAQPLVVAWLDGAPRLGERSLPANVRIVDRRAAAGLFQALSGSNAGLPFAVMRDRWGKVCAVSKERLTAPRVALLRRQCSVP